MVPRSAMLVVGVMSMIVVIGIVFGWLLVRWCSQQVAPQAVGDALHIVVGDSNVTYSEPFPQNWFTECLVRILPGRTKQCLGWQSVVEVLLDRGRSVLHVSSYELTYIHDVRLSLKTYRKAWPHRHMHVWIFVGQNDALSSVRRLNRRLSWAAPDERDAAKERHKFQKFLRTQIKLWKDTERALAPCTFHWHRPFDRSEGFAAIYYQLVDILASGLSAEPGVFSLGEIPDAAFVEDNLHLKPPWRHMLAGRLDAQMGAVDAAAKHD